MRLYIHDVAADTAAVLHVVEQGCAVARVGDLRKAACVACGRTGPQSVEFSSARLPSVIVPHSMPLMVALAQPCNADGLSVRFTARSGHPKEVGVAAALPVDAEVAEAGDKAGENDDDEEGNENEEETHADRACEVSDRSPGDCPWLPSPPERPSQSAERRPGAESGEAARANGEDLIEGRCARCRKHLRFAWSQRSVPCPACLLENLAVDAVNKQADCSVCHTITHRYEGQLRIQCPNCGDVSRVGRCRRCSVEFVYRETEAKHLTELPCPERNCPELTPIDRNEQAAPVRHKQLVPQFGAARGRHTVDSANKFHLVIQFYLDRNPRRRAEYCRALEMNLNNPYIEAVHLFLDGESDAIGFLRERFGNALDSGRLEVRGERLAPGTRLTFEQAFEFACVELTDQLCIIANTDIGFDETLAHVNRATMRNKLYALSRYDVTGPADQPTGLRFNRFLAPMSQDAWIFLTSHFDESFRSFIDLNFELGRMGSDNRAIYEFERAGVQLSNPAEVVCIRHFHAVRDESSDSATKAVQGPFRILHPSNQL